MEILLRQIKRAGIGSRVNLSSRFAELSGDRSTYLERGREYSRMTLPYILPEQGPRNGAANQHGYSSVGSQAVNHLSNKIVTTLFPPQASFFIQDLTSEGKKKMQAKEIPLSKIKQLLSVVDSNAMKQMNVLKLRKILIELIKQLIIGGTSVLYLHPKKNYSEAIPLDRFVISVNSDNTLLELIIEDCVRFKALPTQVQTILKTYKNGIKYYKSEDVIKFYKVIMLLDSDKEEYLYCEVCDDALVKMPQYIKGQDNLPWIPVFWNRHYRENYGRGHVEDNSGDHYVMEFLSEALIRGMVLMSEIKYFIKPGSVIDPAIFASSPSGEVLIGNIDDIGVLQLEKYADYTPIAEVLKEYERRLGRVYLLNSAVRRDAERVEAIVALYKLL